MSLPSSLTSRNAQPPTSPYPSPGAVKDLLPPAQPVLPQLHDQMVANSVELERQTVRLRHLRDRLFGVQPEAGLAAHEIPDGVLSQIELATIETRDRLAALDGVIDDLERLT